MSALSIKIGRSCQINFHEAAKPIAKTFHVNYLLDMLKKIFQYPVLAACRFWRPVFLVLPVFCLMAGDAFCAEKSRPLRKNAPEPIVVQSRGLKKAAPKGVYNMREAVMQALSHNPSLAAEEAQSRSSEETRKSRRGAFGPKLGMSYTATKQERARPSHQAPGRLNLAPIPGRLKFRSRFSRAFSFLLRISAQHCRLIAIKPRCLIRN